eukprot:CAMPEP_0182557246 /NCGR_PEP_ID=MMETSP1324-20130603/1221_1 /TAXON_ID=236786 /ORGANISM="Florenciella sp., Strain RCC1587" /LENGTH=247 /DNA_ID=CAMNT_0024769265 /DNA_START=118 /DNA_END=862 /DNA_ORIENTATION=-
MRAVILALALVFGVAVAGRSDKAAYARGMVEDLDWGIMSTISTASDHVGAPFGNPQSHAEVDGVIYFYVSDMDQSMIDIASNNQVGYTLSNAEKLSSPACGTIPYAGDEESPLCSRLSITGNFLNISGTDEEQTATDALFAKHPAMKNWPADHSWFVGKLDITQLWEINMFGGAATSPRTSTTLALTATKHTSPPTAPEGLHWRFGTSRTPAGLEQSCVVGSRRTTKGKGRLRCELGIEIASRPRDH